MSNQTPLYSALIQHHRLGRSAFHTPGHSGKPISYLDHLLQLDVTELPDTDSLYEAEHVILQAEHHAAQVFGTARTLFSAGGFAGSGANSERSIFPRGSGSLWHSFHR